MGGLSAEAWVAIATAALAVVTLILAGATVALVVLGRAEIIAIREEAKQERTLEFCHRYDCEIVLDEALRRLGAAREAAPLAKNASNISDATTVLNYLDSLAIGIGQKLYIEELARDHVEALVRHHVEQYLSDSSPDLGLQKQDYVMLLAMAKRWSVPRPIPDPKTRYVDKRKS